MTEEEWMTGSDLEQLHRVLDERDASWRKFKLLSCACCRLIWPLLTYPGLRELVQLTEHLADGLLDYEIVNAFVLESAERTRHIHRRRRSRKDRLTLATTTVVGNAAFRDLAVHGKCEGLAEVLAEIPEIAVVYLSGWKRKDGQIAFQNLLAAQRRKIADRIRDIFGNPFRPITFSPVWRTDTAVSLARTMYDSRDFSAMPILADAIQDAGCDNDDILNHCRDAQQLHVRGCWVVDLVLGRE